MADEADIEKRFWKALRGDMTLMLGLDGVEDGHARPMTAQLEDEDRGPIWFFGAKDSGLAKALAASGRDRAIAAYASKGHDIFATIHGRLVIDNDRAQIEKHWNRYVAAWYPGGQDDPNLALMRFDAESAEIWLNGSSLVAGFKALLGSDPKKDYQSNTAQVRLG